ncbi:MAG: hypothetical protein C0598_04430 [Marinilabiliales bacterium]|nr:MAG: hypothetical protein C0598_04430 [Marinilabiliales bacterium]
MSKLYSTDKILMYVDNDQHQCNELLRLFVDTVPEEIESLEKAISNKNWDEAYLISHRIKPSMGITLSTKLSDDYSNLHENIRLKRDPESLKLIFEEFKNNVYQAINQIKSDIN